MDFLKSPVEPQKQITPREHIKGLIDDYGDITEDVLLLEGETHLYRKPVSSAKRAFVSLSSVDIPSYV